jgi:hypothetical protein
MITQRYNSEQEWLDARRGKVTGTRLKDLIVKRGTGYKAGFYEMIAERVALPPNGENVMDRGHRLETDALARFAEETGKEVDGSLVMWLRDDNENIAISPDGVIGKTEAVECKCLSSARHIEAWLNKYDLEKTDFEAVPSDYKEQVIQYFVVNDELETLYFVFFDPRMPRDFFYLTIRRDDVQERVAEALELERFMLQEAERIEQLLTF